MHYTALRCDSKHDQLGSHEIKSTQEMQMIRSELQSNAHGEATQETRAMPCHAMFFEQVMLEVTRLDSTRVLDMHSFDKTDHLAVCGLIDRRASCRLTML